VSRAKRRCSACSAEQEKLATSCVPTLSSGVKECRSALWHGAMYMLWCSKNAGKSSLRESYPRSGGQQVVAGSGGCSGRLGQARASADPRLGAGYKTVSHTSATAHLYDYLDIRKKWSGSKGNGISPKHTERYAIRVKL